MDALLGTAARLIGGRGPSPWAVLGWVAIGVLAATGAGFLVAAGYLGLTTIWAPAWAAAAVGGVLLALCAIGVAAERLYAARRRAAHRRQQAALAENAQEIAALVAAEVEKNPYEAVIMALIAGTVVGANPEVRTGIMDALR